MKKIPLIYSACPSLLVFVSIFSCFYTQFVSCQCLDDQRSVLLELKKSLKFANYSINPSNKLEDWNQSTDCCHWSSITCDNSSGRVLGLDLSGKGITSSINNSSPLFRLRFLQRLNLGSNYMQGTLPGKIFQIPTLRSLDLSSNAYLQGTLPDFYKNGSLEEIDLTGTNFSGSLPSSISNLNRLRTIWFSSCYLHGYIPSSMGSLNLLERVDLSDNQFTGPIPSFSSARNLTYLNLMGNNLNGSITATDWGKLLNLTQLDLSNNLLDGSIPTSLFSLPSLFYLQLQNNKFELLDEFTSIDSSMLEYLDLSNNNLEGPVPKSVSQLRELQDLDLSSNRFNGTLKLTEFLHNLNNLEFVDLSHNNLSIDSDDYGHHGVNSSFPQLHSLKLVSCNLRVMPNFLKNQTSLNTLDLSVNQISGTVPGWMWEIGSNDGIFYLNLSYNHLMNLEPPQTLRNSSDFSYSIDLHSNNLQGQFPAVGPLVELNCANNSFTSIDPNISHYISNVQSLSFSRNELNGSIPVVLCNATSLFILNLEYNNLGGTIPDCLIAKIPSISVLNLRGNSLEGTIPSAFGKDCQLQTLDLNGNYLRGQLPQSLAYCKALMVLDLGDNQFNDTFPCHLKTLSQLRVLSLRSNKFHGTMVCPKTHLIWPRLQIVDLSFNHFTGELTAQMLLKWTLMMTGTSRWKPRRGHLAHLHRITPYSSDYPNSVSVTFKGFSYKLQYILSILTVIDFSNNDLHGELPKELGNLNALVVLSLSHNSFSGSIPSSFGNLSQIQSLDLSCNAFSGNIPSQLANLNYLAYLNLSFNKLSGKIPTSTQLQSFDISSYEGNQGLYGPPFTHISTSTPDLVTTPSLSPQEPNWSSKSEIEWMLRGAGVGFPVGITIFLGPLFYIKRYREWYCRLLHRLLMKILPKEDHARERRRGRRQQRQRR